MAELGARDVAGPGACRWHTLFPRKLSTGSIFDMGIRSQTICRRIRRRSTYALHRQIR
jgi:hypothetical protein